MKTRQSPAITGLENRKRLAWLILTIGLMLCVWSFWPLSSEVISFPLSSMYLQGGQVVLDWPSVVRRGEAQEVYLGLDTTGLLIEIESSDGPTLLSLTDLAADFNPVFEARLELAGSDISPSGALREPFAPGQQVEYEWFVIPRNGGRLNGRVWLYLELVPKDSEELVTVLYPVLARPLEIESSSLLGLGVFGVRGLGGCLILISSGLLWFFRKKTNLNQVVFSH